MSLEIRSNYQSEAVTDGENRNLSLIEMITENRNRGIIVWLFNIGAEKYWNNLSSGVVDVNEDIVVNRIEEINLLICREQDIMILRKKPDNRYLNALRENGITVPQILSLDTDDLVTPISQLILVNEKIKEYLTEISNTNNEVYFVPYAVTYIEEEIAKICNLNIIGAPSSINSIVNDKVFSRQLAEQLGFSVCDGKICGNIDEIKRTYHFLRNNPPYYDKVIIKEPFGASGKGLYVVDSEDQLNAIVIRLARVARKNKQARWLVEGWYRKKADVNYQIYVASDGKVNVFSIKRQLLKHTVYIGSKMPPDLSDHIIEQYLIYGEKIGKYLFEMGYTGVAGIDSIIDENDLIIPIIEINGRFTLSTYLSFIERTMGKKKFMTRYHRIVTHSPMDYEQICSILDSNEILYSQQKGKGVFIFTSGTLPSNLIPEKGYCIGRLFMLLVAEHWDEIDEYYRKVEDIIKWTITTPFQNRKEYYYVKVQE